MIRLPAYFSGFSSRADGSAGLRFTTQEIPPEDFAEFKRALNSFGWVVFKENELSDADIPDDNAEEEGISPTERLRRRMFVYWREKKIETDFNTWKSQQLEVIGNSYLEKLQ